MDRSIDQPMFRMDRSMNFMDRPMFKMERSMNFMGQAMFGMDRFVKFMGQPCLRWSRTTSLSKGISEGSDVCLR